MFEAFKVGVQISLMSNAASVLGSIASQLGTVNSHVGRTNGQFSQLEQTLSRIKTQALIGGAMAGAGLYGLSLLKGPLDEAKKFQTETAKFASLGFGDKITDQAVKFATGMKTVGTSATENLALVSDAMAVFKDLHHAEFAAPIMAKMKFANEAIFGKEGGGANERKFMDMLKVIEFRGGLSSQGEFSTQANFVQQVISGSRNRVDAGQLLSALKTGGVALSQRSNESFYLGSEPLIQEFGGQRYGTGAMSIYQNLVQARGTITAQQELFRLGLLDKSMVQFNQMGQLKKAMPGAFIGSGILEKEGELALLNKVLLPAFAAKGITGDEAIIREMGMILGNRTGSGLMSRIYQQRSTIAMQSEANKNALGINGLATTAEKTLAGQEIALHAKWRDVMKELGTAVLPLAIKAAQGLITVLNGVVKFAREFPTLTKGMVYLFGIISAAVAVGGVVMVAGAAFKALGLALSFSSVGGALGIAKIGMGLKFLGVGLAFLAGSLIGDGIKKLIDKGLSSSGKPETLGGWLHDLTHGEKVTVGPQVKGPQIKVATSSAASLDASTKALQDWRKNNFVAPKSQQPVQVSTQVNMDGRKVAEITSKHQARDAGRPPAGTNNFDGSMNLAPVAQR